jgi:carnosine N-methyltransferase
MLGDAQHLMSVTQHYQAYADYTLGDVSDEEEQFQLLPQQYQDLIQSSLTDDSSLGTRFRRIRQGIQVNDDIIREMLSIQDVFFSNAVNYDRVRASLLGTVDEDKMSKVRSGLRQLSRDWSTEGAEERNQCYSRIVKDIESMYPIHDSDSTDSTPPKVLVPGAGLGRLAWELANSGYNSEGNELSYYMLLPAYYALNCLKVTQGMPLAANVHASSNWHSIDDRVKQAKVRMHVFQYPPL